MGGTREGPPAPGLRGVGFCPHRATEVLHGPGRQGSSEGEDKGQELDRMQERKAAHRRREKARWGGCEAQRHELPHPSSGMVRPQELHAALSRAVVPTGRRRLRATRTAAAHGRGRTPRRATLLELAPRPPQGPAQNHMPRVRPCPAPHPAPAGTAASRHAAPAPRRSPPGSRRAPGSAGGT